MTGTGPSACERNDIATVAPTHVVSRRLSQIPWLRHASTCRTFDTRGLPRDRELQEVVRLLGLPPLPAIHARQCHTSNVGVASPDVVEAARRTGAHVFSATDAIVSPVPGLVLAVFTADCVPVLIVDTVTRAVGAVHAGWRGTLSRITEAAVGVMVREGSSPVNLRAWIGPAIGGCCYEVSTELADEFDAEFADARDAGIAFRNARLLDVAALNAYQLHRGGIPWQGISSSDLCTLHGRNRFFTYRGDGPSTGRIISCIAALEDGAT